MYFFTADIHFADTKSMKDDYRPFKNIKEYDKFVIKDWNKTAKKGDTIFVIGDLLDCDGVSNVVWQKGLSYIKKIKADVVLIVGNNEERIIAKFFGGSFDAFAKHCIEQGIKSVHKNLVIELHGQKFNLVHQIMHGDKRYTNLFGHTHLCSGVYHPYGLCLSTDLNHFRLFTEEILFSYLERKREYWEPDDNTNYPNPFIKKANGKWINIKKKDSAKWQKYLKDNTFSIFKKGKEKY